MPDDDEPVSMPWILAAGFEPVSNRRCIAQSDVAGPVCYLEWDEDMGCDGWRVSNRVGQGVLIPPCDTRGQVRRLAFAFGINLRAP